MTSPSSRDLKVATLTLCFILGLIPVSIVTYLLSGRSAGVTDFFREFYFLSYCLFGTGVVLGKWPGESNKLVRWTSVTLEVAALIWLLACLLIWGPGLEKW